MSQLEFVGTKVPSGWISKLKRLTEETGKTQSAIVRDAIAAALGINVANPVNPLREDLDNLKARVQALEELTQLSMVNQKQETEVNRVKPIAAVTVTTPSPKSKTSTPKPTASTPPIAGELLTMRGLSKALTDLGRQHSQKNLSSRINESVATQQLPSDLIALGVRADWEAEAKASKYSNQRRWLSLEG